MNTGDEFFHEPTEEQYWSESHYLDATDLETGVTVQARVGFYPNREAANFWGFVWLEDEGNVYWVRDEEIPLKDVHGLTIREDEWRFGMYPEEPGQTWNLVLEGTLQRTSEDDPKGMLLDRGEPKSVRLELDIESRHDPFYYSEGQTTSGEDDSDRYEVATEVEGLFETDDRVVEFSGPGERDHSWGRRKWAGDAEWLWISGSFEDGTAYNHTNFWLRGDRDQGGINGFFFDGEIRQPILEAEVNETPTFGPETSLEWTENGTPPRIVMEFVWDGGETTIEVEPFLTTPVEWRDHDRGQRSLLNRSAARQTRDGDVDGVGFLENNIQIDLD